MKMKISNIFYESHVYNDLQIHSDHVICVGHCTYCCNYFFFNARSLLDLRRFAPRTPMSLRKRDVDVQLKRHLTSKGQMTALQVASLHSAASSEYLALFLS